MAGRNLWRTVALILATALVTLGGTLLVQARVLAPSASTITGGEFLSVRVVRGPTATSTNSTAFENLPDATTTVAIPDGGPGLILARFSAQSGCSDPEDVPDLICETRILIGGRPGAPTTSGPNDYFSWDTTSTSCCRNHSLSMDRSRGPLDPGIYRVRVQYRVVNADSLTLSNWALTVEVFRAAP